MQLSSSFKLAIIGPSFFGYLERLAILFQARGIAAEYFDERPSNTTLGKVFFRFAPAFLKSPAVSSLQKHICEEVRKREFTHALVISPEIFSADSIRLLKSYGIRVCRYGWDSVKNKPHMGSLDEAMDAIASFDPEDCRKYGYQLIPLYAETVTQRSEALRDIDLMYCATFHSTRPQWIQKIAKVCKRRNWSLKLMLFYHARWLWLMRYLLQPWLLGQINLFQTRSFASAEIMQATKRCRVVIDLHHLGQTGLTMRTFEALSHGAIVLTTNQSGAATLPESLKTRVVTLNYGSIEKDIELALNVFTNPLSAEELYFLSVDRFLDQIETLVFVD